MTIELTEDVLLSLITPKADPVLPLFMGDILKPEADLLPEPETDDKVDQEPPSAVQKLLDLYDEPTADGPVEKQGLQAGKQIDHTGKFALHLAAREGNVDAIIRIAKKGHDVNVEDHLSSRPLHVAALFGHNDAVRALIKLGADVHDPSYMGETALHIALMKQHYAVARTLILEGKADPNQVTDKNVNAFTILCKHLSTDLIAYQHEKSSQIKAELRAEILDILKTIDVCAAHCGSYCLSSTTADQVVEGLALPVSLLLKAYAYKDATGELKAQVLHLAEKIAAHDPSEALFCEAKNILHIFPTGGVYSLFLDNKQYIFVEANGNVPFVATALSKQSIQDYVASLKGANTPQAGVFKNLAEVFALSHEFSKGCAEMAVAEKAAKMFHEGKTLLLPTGWNGHFVDVILSKEQGLYGVANSGEGYRHIKPGVNFYKIADPELIDAKFIHDILTNNDQMKFEYDHMYQYGLIEKNTLIATPPQIHGNCSWQSQRTAMEGLLYVELLNSGLDHKQAKAKAHQYYDQWDSFNAHHQIDHFFANPPALSAKALLDIVNSLHHPVSKMPLSNQDKACADKILKQLVSPKYIDECRVWLNDQNPELGKGMMKILPQYGIKANAFAEATPGLFGGAFNAMFGKLADPAVKAAAPAKFKMAAAHHDVAGAPQAQHHEEFVQKVHHELGV